MRMCAHPTIFDLLFPSPFSDKKYAEKTQTEKKCERANTENRLPSNPFSLLLRIIVKQKKKNFQKKLLHSYLLLKGAQYFYTFAQNSK